MSSTAGRFIFVFFLIINCILWSRSRYGQPVHTSLLRSDVSLVKRISLELLQPQETDTSSHEASIPFIDIHPLFLIGSALHSVDRWDFPLLRSVNMFKWIVESQLQYFVLITSSIFTAQTPRYGHWYSLA